MYPQASLPTAIDSFVITLAGSSFAAPLDVRSPDVQALFLLPADGSPLPFPQVLDLVADNERSALLTTLGRLQLFGWVRHETDCFCLSPLGAQVLARVEQAFPQAKGWAQDAVRYSWQQFHDRMLAPFRADLSLEPALRSLNAVASRGAYFVVQGTGVFPEPGRVAGMYLLLEQACFSSTDGGFHRAYSALSRLQEIGCAQLVRNSDGLEARITSYGRRALLALEGLSGTGRRSPVG